MEIVLDIDDAVPPFARDWLGTEVTELVDQIEVAVRRGELRGGDPLPSTRQLANDLGIDEAVVAKAYRLLEHASIIRTGLLGTYVRSDAAAVAQR